MEVEDEAAIVAVGMGWALECYGLNEGVCDILIQAAVVNRDSI